MDPSAPSVFLHFVTEKPWVDDKNWDDFKQWCRGAACAGLTRKARRRKCREAMVRAHPLCAFDPLGLAFLRVASDK